MVNIKSEFVVDPDCIELRTMTNGDQVRITRIHLGVAATSNLATLINSGIPLKVIIKEDVPE